MVKQAPLVLIVEDDPQSRDGYAEFLERGGFRVAQASNAEDALAQSLAMVPDVIITDIALPGRDGFALATEIRGEERTQRIPVVAMTAYWAPDVHERADKAGITAILAKPCQPEHLIAELNRVLHRPRASRAAAHASERKPTQARVRGASPLTAAGTTGCRVASGCSSRRHWSPQPPSRSA